MYTKKIRFLLLFALAVLIQTARAQNPCTLDVQIAPPGAISCQNQSVQLQATVTPPGNYDIFWSGPQQVSPVLNPVVQTPGIYVLFVSDSLQGCWGADTVLVAQDGSVPQVILSASATDCNGAGTIAATASGGGPFTYQWMNGATTPGITYVSQGSPLTFCVTVTNTASGCTGTSCITVTNPVPLTAEIGYFDTPFCNDSLGMWVNVAGGIPPYAYQWSNGSTFSWIPDPQAGTYVVTITDAAGCTAVTSYVIEEDPWECAHLEGYVLADWNTNCTKESTDDGLAFSVLHVTDGSGNEFFASTDAAGFYRIELYPGTYTVAVIPSNNLWDPCQASFSVTLDPNQTLVQDFLLQPQAVCPAMTVDIGTTLLRRCFQGQYWVSYCNQGTAEATNSYVEILFDPFLTLTNAQIPYTDLGNNLYRFDLGTVPFNSCGNFWVTVNVSCSATLGQAHCTEAVIYPTGVCEPANAQWSGASLQLQAQCNTDSLDFTIKNVGTGPMSSPLEYVIIEDAVMLMQAPPPAIVLNPGEQYQVTVPANGATWRLEVAQEPFHPGNSQPSLAVEGCATGGQFTTGYVNQFPLDDNDPWVDIDCTQNTGSYDPNDKQGFPTGYNTAHYIGQGTDIEYLIRFQNTGTDTAFTVVLRDQLSPWLDPASVKPGASSHPYTFDYYGDRNIKFTFDDIRLPDSSANFEASQGFVSFRVSQKAGVPLETDILNTAGIFFDFNEPVYTNTTVHRVGRDFVTVSAWQPAVYGLDLRIAPNPVTQSAVLELRGVQDLGEWQVELLDATGRPVRSANVSGTQWRFERSDLPAGLYLLQVRANGQLLGAGKVMLR